MNSILLVMHQCYGDKSSWGGTILKCFACVSYSRIPVVSGLGLYWSLLHQEERRKWSDLLRKNPLLQVQGVINCMHNMFMLRADLQPLDGFKVSQPVLKLRYSLYRINMRWEILHAGCSRFAALLI